MSHHRRRNSDIITRCYLNELDPETDLPQLQSQQIIKEIDAFIQKHWDSVAKKRYKHHSIYSGQSGVLYLYLYMIRNKPDFLDFNALLIEAEQLADIIMRNEYLLDNSDNSIDIRIGFLSGDAGTLSLCAVTYHLVGQRKKYENLIQNLISLGRLCLYDTNPDDLTDVSNELLVGRIGYVMACLFVNHFLNENVVDYNATIEPVIKKILEKGRELHLSHLSWKWHGKEYIGAVHGIAGILYVMLHMEQIRTNTEHINEFDKTCQWLLKQQLPTGNFPSHEGKEDLLVQFCHGAPGAFPLLLRMYQITGKKEYLESCKQACDCIWKYGVLRKGACICHGTAGNLYVFLHMYSAFPDTKYCKMAIYFALKAMESVELGVTYKKNLYEGSSGVLIALWNVRQALQHKNVPLKLHFPAFDLL